MIDIESLIPHREPIKIITEVIELNDNAWHRLSCGQ